MSVADLTQGLQGVLRRQFRRVWVSGEVSSVRRPSSGHVYFTLKDDQAQISSVLWRRTAGRLDFELEDGLAVVAEGSLDV